MGEFHASLIAATGGSVKLASLSSKGRALLAGKKFRPGEILFAEEPLSSLQHHRNKGLCRACERCGRFVGTLSGALRALATVEIRSDHLPADATDGLQQTINETLPALPLAWTAPGVAPEDDVLSPEVPCDHGCGTLYCSKSCKDKAAMQYHTILCPMLGDDEGDDDDEHAVNAAELFRVQAQASNEIFLLAAKVLSRVLESWVRNGNDMPRAMAPVTALYTKAYADVYRARAEGDRALNALHSESSLEQQREEEREARAQVERQIAQMQEWMGDSLAIFKALVRERLPLLVSLLESKAAGLSSSSSSSSSSSTSSAAVAHLASGGSRTALSDAESELLLSHTAYDRLISGFELNNIEMKIDSPLRDYAALVEQMAGISKTAAVSKLMTPVFAQIAQARLARREVRRDLRRLERQAALDGDDDAGDADDDDASMGLDGDETGGRHPPHYHAQGAAAGAGGGLAHAVAGAVGEGAMLEEEGAVAGSEGGEEGDSSESDYESGVDTEDEASVTGGGRGPAWRPSQLFPHCNGTALFSVICLMNHSCSPNVQIVYSSGSHSAVAIAQRLIAPGEEMCINYVDVDDESTTAERRAELMHYGFTCRCERCGP